MPEDDSMTKTAQAIAQVAKEVPIYPDLIQPAARELGKSLATLAKTVNIALVPVSVLVWWYDKVKDFLEKKVSEKLENIPPENIQSPSLLIAWPLIDWLKYAGHEESLQNLFANLLANAMDKDTAGNTHPWFVQIIQNLLPDEAKILKLFSEEKSKPIIDVKILWPKDSGYHYYQKNYSTIWKEANCNNPDLTPGYLDNLMRLGLVEVLWTARLKEDKFYEKLESSEEIEILMDKIDSEQNWKRIDFNRKIIELTSLGALFCKICVIDKA
jgi:hypothetical protein